MAAAGGSSLLLLLLVTAASAALAQEKRQLYQQCGGRSQCEQHTCDDVAWPGVACADGLACQRQTEWFWQCMEDKQGGGSASSPSPAPGPSETPAPSSSPAPSPASTAVAEAASKPKATPSPPAASPGPPPSSAAASPASTSPPAAAPPAPTSPPPAASPPAPTPSPAPAKVPDAALATAIAAAEAATRPAGAPSSVPATQAASPQPAAPQASPSGSPSPSPSSPAPSPPPAASPSPPAARAANASSPLPAPASSPSPAPAKAAPSPPAPLAKGAVDAPGCPPYLPTATYRRGNFTDWVNTTRTISPKRPSANVEAGEWIPGRATFYGTNERIEAAHVACGEPAGQYGIIEHGSCGFTNADGSLPYPVDGYAAAADSNEDYPGSCGRCYQIRCRSGIPQNNGRDIHISDLQYYRTYNITDDQGRYWPGNRLETQDRFHTECWDEDATITVRIGDSCPCYYSIRVPTPELRLQPWCCGGQNHFDLSVWAFQKLLHPTYGVMKMEYRPVDCSTNQPIKPVPGFISRTIYRDGPQPGWGWRPYFSKNHVLREQGAGVKGGTAACATLSKSGAMSFFCRNCTQEGYQPFAGAKALEFWIRSNTPEGADKYASSTPRGVVPALKVFLMHDEANQYCGREIILGPKQVVSLAGADWFKVSLPLTMWACDKGSAGSLASINRVDFQNILLRDADVCIDDIVLTT